MPGSQAEMLTEFLNDGFIAVDFGVDTDLNGKFTEEFREFSKKMITVIQEFRPEKIDMGSYNSDSTSNRQNINDLSEKGYLGSVERTKKMLEEIYKKS